LCLSFSVAVTSVAGAWLDSFAITKCETIDIQRLLYSDYELGVIENRGALKTTSASKTILGAAKFLGIGNPSTSLAKNLANYIYIYF